MFGAISEEEANELEKEVTKFRKSFILRENWSHKVSTSIKKNARPLGLV
jgi:hypothetical protein